MFEKRSINGIDYQIYYPNGVNPDNINSNTQVAIYMHGGGAQMVGATAAVNCLEQGSNTDSIVIIPSISNGNRNNPDFYNNVVNMYDNFISENGINQNNLVISGFSSGYRSTFGILDTYLAEHPNSDPASVYLVETYIQQGDQQYQYDYDTYKTNGTMFYSYTGRYGNGGNHSSWGVTYSDVLNPLNDNGCNVMNILEGRIVDHQGAEKVFFEDGIIDFSKGNLTLTSDKYTYQIKNPQTGLWEEVNVNDINTLEKLSKRFGITKLPMIIDDKYFTNLNYLSSLSLSDETISTDSDVLLGNIGNMYSVIKGSTFVKNSYASSGTASTTKVPSAIPEVINKYFSSVSGVLCSLGAFLKKCEESNTLMEETEEDIRKDTENLNEYEAINLNDRNPYNVPSAQPRNPVPTPVPTPSPTPSNPGTDVPTQEPPKQDADNDISTSSNWQEEFPEFDELYSTNDKVVFDYNNEYRVIVHRDGETITGIEYYYDFGNNENATSSLLKLKSMYENSNVENIMVKGRYVKVIFDKNMFNNLSVSEFRNKYSNLNEIVRL